MPTIARLRGLPGLIPACVIGLAGLIGPGSASGQETFQLVPRSQAADLFKSDQFAERASFGANLPPALPPAPREAATRCLAEARDLAASGRWRDALDATGRAIAADPSFGDAYAARASLYDQKHLFAHAIATVTAGLAVRPDDPILWSYRALLRSRQGDAAGALADIAEAARHPDGLRASALYLARCQASILTDDRAALGELAALIARGEDDASIHADQGTRHVHLGQWAEAEAAYDRAATLEPRSEYRLWRGLARLRAGRFAAALEDYEAVRGAYRNGVATQVRYGLALFAAGRTGDAIGHLNSLLERWPDDGWVQTACGWVALLRGELAEASDLFNAAAEPGSERIMLKTYLAPRLIEVRALDSALADFEARCGVAPNLPWALIIHGRDEAKTGVAPNPEFSVTFVCRFLNRADLAPVLAVQLSGSHPDDPWRGAAHLGEVIAASCLGDGAKFRRALGNLAVTAWGAPPSADHPQNPIPPEGSAPR